MKNLLELTGIFLRIGLFTFGGGYAMLPLLQSELVEKKKWLSQEELMNYFCIGQSTPGIIAVNVATFVGYKQAKVIGAIISTLALVTFPVVIILSLANILLIYKENPYVKDAFIGIRIVVTVLIFDTVIKLWKNIKGYRDFLLFFLALIASVCFDVSPIIIVFSVVILGLLYSFRKNKK